MTEQIAYNRDMTEEVQEIIEVLPADGFGPPAPTEIITPEIIDPSLLDSLWHYYLMGLGWILPALMIVGGYIVLRYLIWESLRFNYYHYLEHGEFVILWGDNDGNYDRSERRKKIAKELKIIDPDFVSWFAALVMSIVVFLLHVVIALLWPITIILVMPLGIVRLIGFRKRKKIAFTQKLKGEHLKA